MKKISRFDSQPLSINPDLAQPASSANRSIPSFRILVLSASFLGALAVAIVACSKEAHKPAVSTSSISAPQPIVAAQTAPAPPAAPETKTVAKKTAKKRPAKVTYKNTTYGVAFQYPRRYSLKTGDEAIVDWFGAQPGGMNFVDQGGIAVATVELPRGLYPGTDYRDGFFAVSVNRNLSADQCSQFGIVDSNDSDEEPIAPSNVNFGGQVYSETSTFEGQSFQQSYGHYYHVYNNGACYEMALDLETAGYGVVEGITPVDRDEVFHQLEAMLSSVRLQPETNPETQPALAVTPAPSAAPAVAETADIH
jgi:hypothetical protein